MARSKSKHQYPQAFLDMIGEAGFANPSALAVAIGNPDALRNVMRGRTRTLRGDTLAAIAAKLGRSMDEVSEALGLPTGARDGAGRVGFDANYPPGTLVRRPVKAGASLPVRFVVQAGAWIEVDDAAQARIASPPITVDDAYPADLQWLELVRGDSADLFYPEGIFVHVVDAVGIGYAPRHDDFVVVERKRDQGGLIERSLKQIARKGRKIELWPRSRNPKWKAPLDLADSDEDHTEIVIAALVLGGYFPARR